MIPKPDSLDIGLKPEVLNQLHGIFQTYTEIDTVVLYGSRAKGNYHAGSDVDITIKGEGVTESLVGKVEEDIDDLLLPFSFDISSWTQIDNVDLRAHIERVGIVIYRRVR
jgi:predicted nucleotidyltransferase